MNYINNNNFDFIDEDIENEDDSFMEEEDEDVEMYDPFECIHLKITDDLLKKSKVAAYMLGQQLKTPEGDVEPYAPKKFPEKAIDIFIPYANNTDDNVDEADEEKQKAIDKYEECEYIEVYLDTKEKVWDSRFIINDQFGKLSPDQMEQLFKLETFKNLVEKIQKVWPLSDPFYNELFNAVQHKQLRIGMTENDLKDYYKDNLLINNKSSLEDDNTKKNDTSNEDDQNLEEVDQAHKRVDLANKDLTGDGVRDYSGSGRKIIHFGDMGIIGKSIRYFCWPRKNKTFKWNSWANWDRIKPFARMTFMYNGRKYMVTISLTDEGLKNRGFRGADLTWTPPLAWLTPVECEEVMRLSRVRRFIRQCVLRVRPLLAMKPAEIYEKIDKKDKVTEKQIEKTQRVIRDVIHQIFIEEQTDNYTYD